MYAVRLSQNSLTSPSDMQPGQLHQSKWSLFATRSATDDQRSTRNDQTQSKASIIYTVDS